MFAAELLQLKHYMIINDENKFDTHLKLIAAQTIDNPSQFPCNNTNQNGYTLLHWACHLNKPQFARKLLEVGYSPDARTLRGKTPLMICLERSVLPPNDMVEIFLADYGHFAPRLNHGDDLDRTVLHMAAIKGFDEIVEKLLEAGALVNSVDKKGWSSLHFAAFYKRESVAKVLLNHGADVNLMSNDGWTPTHAASFQGHDPLLSLLVTEFGAEVNSKSMTGQTALHVACLNQHASTVKILRENDADPKITDKSGLTSLACAPKEIRSIIRRTASKIESSPKRSAIVGMPHNPIAEREAKFALQARDKWGRKRTQGGDTFSVEIIPIGEALVPSKSASQISSSTPADQNDSATSPPPESSTGVPTDTIYSTVNTEGNQATNGVSKSSQSTPSLASPSQANRTKSNQTESSNNESPNWGRSKSDFKGIARQEVTNQSTIKDLENGLYVVKWRPLEAGTYQVSIKMRSTHIKGSPFSLVVSAARVRIPTDVRRQAIRGVTARNNSEDVVSDRTQSHPVDLISSMKPDMSIKSTSTSTPVLSTKKKQKNKPTTVTSPIQSEKTHASSSIGEPSRRRSASMSPKPNPQTSSASPSRDRSGTTIASPSQSFFASEPSPNSSTQRDRSLHRVTTVFSPLRPLSEKPAEGSESMANQISTQEETINNLTKQVTEFSLRIQELETEKIILEKSLETERTESKAKLLRVATALRAERTARLCNSCKSVSRNAVAVPCLHLSLCVTCIETVDTCDVCAEALRGFISVKLDDTVLEPLTPK